MLVMCFMIIGCGTNEGEKDAVIKMDDVKTVSGRKVKVIELSDNKGTDVDVVIESITYQDSYYVGFMDMYYKVNNLVDNNFKEVKFAVLAWDRDGFPLKLNEVDYTDIVLINNLPSMGSEEYVHEIHQTLDIGYISMFMSEYTDFDGNTWVNPIMEEIKELEGTMLKDTNLSYFVFE